MSLTPVLMLTPVEDIATLRNTLLSVLCAVVYVEVWYVKKQFKYHTLVENGETEIQTQDFVLPRDALFLFSLLLFDEIKMQCSSETSFSPVRSLEMSCKLRYSAQAPDLVLWWWTHATFPMVPIMPEHNHLRKQSFPKQLGPSNSTNTVIMNSLGYLLEIWELFSKLLRVSTSTLAECEMAKWHQTSLLTHLFTASSSLSPQAFENALGCRSKKGMNRTSTALLC